MRYLAPILAVLLIGAASQPAPAQPYRARQGVQSGEVRSLDEILNGIRRERPGSLADVQGPNAGPAGDPRYRLKWVTPDGRVLWLDTDARTGRVLGVEGDDRGPPVPRGGFGGFDQRRGNFGRGGPEDLGPPEGPPRDFGRGRQRSFDPGPPPGFDQGPPRGFGRGRGPGPDDGPGGGQRGRFGRFRER